MILDYLDWEEWENPKPIHYYLMQIAQETRRCWVKNPRNVPLKDFLLDFKGQQKPKSKDPRMIEMLKAKWKMITGLIKPKANLPQQKIGDK